MNGRPAALVLILALGGCATRGDVRRLEDAVLLLRAEQARRDSSQLAALGELQSLNRASNDSIAALRSQVAQIKGDLSGDLYSIAQQLVQVQELTGQSQQRLTELRTQLEARGEQMSTAAPAPTVGAAPAVGPTPTTDSAGATAAATGGPTADQIYQASLEQLRRGSVNTARSGFRELLRRYPQSPRAADAVYYIGESFAADQPDSARGYYQQVVDKFGTTPRAATALYKLGLLAEQRRDVAGARALYTRITTAYQNSDEAALARDRLRTLGH